LPTERDALRARVRDLTKHYQAGGRDAFEAYRDLVALLLGITVLAPGGGVRLFSTPGERDQKMVLGGWLGPTDPLPLTDKRYLRLTMSLFRERVPEGVRLKMEKSAIQYQLDTDGRRWVFRYDYLRYPPDPHPAAHVQVRGSLVESSLPSGASLERVHFPTMRVSLEAVIRLLAEDFRTPCQTPADVWRRSSPRARPPFWLSPIARSWHGAGLPTARRSAAGRGAPGLPRLLARTLANDDPCAAVTGSLESSSLISRPITFAARASVVSVSESLSGYRTAPSHAGPRSMRNRSIPRDPIIATATQAPPGRSSRG
jgi:hypothetical protein